METQDGKMQSEQPPHEVRASAQSALLKADHFGVFLTSLPKWAAVAVIVWQAGISIVALADRSAVPSLLLQRFGRQASYWEVVCWIAGALGIFFGLYSRRLLRRQSHFDTARLGALERRFSAIPENPAVNELEKT